MFSLHIKKKKKKSVHIYSSLWFFNYLLYQKGSDVGGWTTYMFLCHVVMTRGDEKIVSQFSFVSFAYFPSF